VASGYLSRHAPQPSVYSRGQFSPKLFHSWGDAEGFFNLERLGSPEPEGEALMSAVILLALSALIGFVFGMSFSWRAIAASSIGLAVLSSAILQIQGFGALPGTAIVVACLTVSQMAYLVGVFYRSRGTIPKTSRQ
jgi:hypothetical protein